MWAPRDPGPAGWDRRRVRARLLAALAGLQELRGLRARQQAAVRGALATHPPPAPAAPRAPRAHERLEAVLVALQEQLVRSAGRGARGARGGRGPLRVQEATDRRAAPPDRGAFLGLSFAPSWGERLGSGLRGSGIGPTRFSCRRFWAGSACVRSAPPRAPGRCWGCMGSCYCNHRLG